MLSFFALCLWGRPKKKWKIYVKTNDNNNNNSTHKEKEVETKKVGFCCGIDITKYDMKDDGKKKLCILFQLSGKGTEKKRWNH